jgi:hypothetical protein
MTESEQAEQSLPWRAIVAAVLLVGGIGIVALSFVWTRVANPRANWSTDQARQFQAAAARLHSLSHQHAQQSQQGDRQKMNAELELAKSEYQLLEGHLDAARSRPKNVAFGLRLTGMALMAAGALGLYRSRAVSAS